MEEDLVQKIEANPKYQKTCFDDAGRYYGYILVIAFDKELLSRKIGSGVMTWGILVLSSI
jgi:uncharacterized membrane protein (DUF485 family)